MSATKAVLSGVLFFLTVMSGVWLTHAGRPLNAGIFAVHKLIALATVVFIGVHVYRMRLTIDLGASVALGVIAISGLAFLALFVSGALLSREAPIAGAILTVHQIAPVLALMATTGTVYLLVAGRS
jgi:hypothetical protein